MEVKNCIKCKRLFNYIYGPQVCHVCREESENLFKKVKNYITKNKGADIDEVSAVCEVEIAQIKEWIREKRLDLVDNTGQLCQKCKTNITTIGRFCDKCKSEVINEIKIEKEDKIVKIEKPEKRNKMHFIGKPT